MRAHCGEDERERLQEEAEEVGDCEGVVGGCGGPVFNPFVSAVHGTKSQEGRGKEGLRGKLHHHHIESTL